MRAVFLSILLAGVGLVAGCGGSGSKSMSSSASTPPSSSSNTGSNVLSIAVNGGPEANQPKGSIYENAAFASATICAPGSASNCVTIDNLLVEHASRRPVRVLLSNHNPDLLGNE